VCVCDEMIVAVIDIKEVLTGKDCSHVKDKNKKVLRPLLCFLTGVLVSMQVRLPVEYIVAK